MTCASMGGYMAVVNSAHENTYLRNFLLTNDGKLVLKNWKKKTSQTKDNYWGVFHNENCYF